jgi:hypothetical protein
MKSFREVEQMIDRARLRTDRTTDEQMLDDALAALAQTMNNRPQVLRPGRTLWRTIMESKATRYSAAALVAMTAALVLVNPLGTSKHGVALADVQERIAQVDTMVLRGQTTFTSVADPNISVQYDNMKYISRDQGFVEDGYLKGTLFYRVILNRQEKRCLLQLVPWKKCLRFPCTEEQIEVMEKLTPTGVVNLFLETDYKKLGVSQVDGIEVEGFEVQDMKPLQDIVPKFLLDIREGSATIWVGTSNLLPVRGEADMVIKANFWTGFMDIRCHEIMILDSYDIELDPKLFDTNIPEGYTEFKITDLLPKRVSAALGAVPMGAVFRARSRSKNRDPSRA